METIRYIEINNISQKNKLIYVDAQIGAEKLINSKTHSHQDK